MNCIQVTSVSVIICTWNSASYLPRCLSSLDKQTYKNFEVIIVDNGSTDSCVDGIKERWPGLNMSIVRWLENRGFAAANNYGAHIARGKWIACLNSDAFPDDNWLEQLMRAAQENPGFKFFASRQLIANAPHLLDDAGDSYSVNGLAKRRFRGYPASEYGLQREEVFSASAAAALYDRSAFLQVGGFDEDFFSYYEDVDLGFRLRLQGFRCLYVPEAMVMHIGSASVGSMSLFALYHWQRNFTWTFLKNMPSPLLWRTLPAHIVANIVYFIYHLRPGRAGAVLSAKIDAIRGLKELLSKRTSIQKNIKIEPSELMIWMEKAGLATYWQTLKDKKVRQSIGI